MTHFVSKSWVLAFCAFILTVINIAYMHYCVGPSVGRLLDIWGPICYICFDASLLILICYILSFGFIRAAAIMSVLFSLLWSIINVLYGRYFGVYFNYHTITEVKNLADGFVWDSVASGVRVKDCIYLIVIVTLGILLYSLRIDNPTRIGRIKTVGVLFIIPILNIMVYGGGRVLLEAASELRHIENRVRARNLTPQLREHDILRNGVFCAQLFDDIILSGKCRNLNDKEISLVNNHLESTHRAVNLLSPKDKNLIFILVESYLAISSDMKINGKEITPFLNKLRHTERVYFNDSVTSNIELGVSGDGQFIYMTGLLPLRGKVTTSRVYRNHLPALPYLIKKANGSQTLMTIPTLPTLWMQTDMCNAYGIERLYSTNDMDFNVNDSTIMDFSLNQELSLADDRFFHTILTISMHGPYPSHSTEGFAFPPQYSPEFCEYLMKCRYTDRQIGRFLQKLKENGLYDNSVIVIASDHEAHTENLKIDEKYSGNKRLPLYIINSDMELDKCWYGTMNQIDLFPTLLDIFGIESEWRGLGCSIVDSASYINRLNEDTRLVSEMIIESDYLAKYAKDNE